jgi:hypothetical protein
LIGKFNPERLTWFHSHGGSHEAVGILSGIRTSLVGVIEHGHGANTDY